MWNITTEDNTFTKNSSAQASLRDHISQVRRNFQEFKNHSIPPWRFDLGPTVHWGNLASAHTASTFELPTGANAAAPLDMRSLTGTYDRATHTRDIH